MENDIETEIIFCPFADDGRLIPKSKTQSDSEIETEKASEIEK